VSERHLPHFCGEPWWRVRIASAHEMDKMPSTAFVRFVHGPLTALFGFQLIAVFNGRFQRFHLKRTSNSSSRSPSGGFRYRPHHGASRLPQNRRSAMPIKAGIHQGILSRLPTILRPDPCCRFRHDGNQSVHVRSPEGTLSRRFIDRCFSLSGIGDGPVDAGNFSGMFLLGQLILNYVALYVAASSGRSRRE